MSECGLVVTQMKLTVVCFVAVMVFCLLDSALAHRRRGRGRGRFRGPPPSPLPSDTTDDPLAGRPGPPRRCFGPWCWRRRFPPGERPPKPTGIPDDHTWDPEDFTGRPPFGRRGGRRPFPPLDDEDHTGEPPYGRRRRRGRGHRRRFPRPDENDHTEDPPAASP